MSYKLTETTKLFYDHYLYKVVIVNGLSSIFRDKNFSFAKKMLDDLQLCYENHEPLVMKYYARQQLIKESDFLVAKYLLNLFEKSDGYTFRIEHPRLTVYSNDKHWLESNLLNHEIDIIEYSQPDNRYIDQLKVKNTILFNNPFDYEYKVTLDSKVDSSVYNWLMGNQNKVKIGQVCLEEIKNNGYVRGFYFYVRDEKVLRLVTLMIGNSITRIDKIVCKANIDK